HKLQLGGVRVFESKQFKRLDRERLLKNGFLQEVVKGWLISSSPATLDGDSTPWYASFWEFCARYCHSRFGSDWYLSPEQSLLLFAENTMAPVQLVVVSPKGNNNTLQLPSGTTLYDLKESQPLPDADCVEKDNLRLIHVQAALVRVQEKFFETNPIEVRSALASIKDPSDLLRRLLEGGRSKIAGRIAGALREMDRASVADEIVKTMKGAGYDVRESNPFINTPTKSQLVAGTSPIASRLYELWQATRQTVIEVFRQPGGLPADRDAYLRAVDDVYRVDAYHSLSIEGYNVSMELIEQVESGNWNPDRIEADRQQRDALAARGYWQAFQVVKSNVRQIVSGVEAGRLVAKSHRDWYRELFQPCAVAGLIKISALAGYRNHPVYLRNSRHIPPRWEAVRDAMPTLFELIESEPSVAVRAVLGHWLFGYIHPYPDGNGRIARFLMNAMLASGGYPWTVIRIEDRGAYLEALEHASVATDLRPFANFVAESMRRSNVRW
ncbi:MAG: Fic family protein, partial [Acidobacteria bacterium]|nr:Fic family protein [Acidobacteriota bacterium]